MKTRPIVPAVWQVNERGIACAPEVGDIYHPHPDHFAQARQVFLAGNQLPERWQGRERFVVLETGFGLGNNFLATWQAWRNDPSRSERLVFISVELRPFTAADLRRAHAQSPAPALAGQLIDAWPPLTHNLHTLEFEGGRVQLLLALGDARDWLPELVATVDAYYLDGFAPALNPPMWQAPLFKALARLAAPGATLATWTAAGAVRQGLRSAGFEVRKAEGPGGKRHITLARYAPAFTPRRAPSRLGAAQSARRVLIVGGGLAGCALARALSAQGWRSTVLDRHDAPAEETSGNPGGLFHGIVNAQDGTHARFNRAAALLAQRVVGQAVARGVNGAVQGLLRLDEAGPAELQAIITRLGLPPDYVQAIDAAQASRLSGLPLAQSAWYYPGGGWAHPAGLARAWLEDAAPLAQWRGQAHVSRLERQAGGWQLLDRLGHVLDEAEVVVLANAADALRLLGVQHWPVESIRGQVSWVERARAPGLALPRMPIAGAGYLLPELNGVALFGATSQAGDADTRVRDEDHAANLAQLARLTGHPIDLPATALQGRAGLRCSAYDKLPLVGGVPDMTRAEARLDQPRLVPRLPGLYVLTALGSRGITWAPLAANTLAALITAAPVPLEASLLDAVDPARFISREARRTASNG